MTTYIHVAGHVLGVCPSFTGSVVVEAIFLDLHVSYYYAYICFCVAKFCAQLGYWLVSGALLDFANSCTA